MKYFVLGSTYIIRLDTGEKILESIRSLCQRDRIGFAVFQGLGAVSEAEIGHYDPSSSDYSTVRIAEPCEIVSLYGTVTVLDGKPFTHAHAALGDASFGVRGGHLFEAVVSAAGEITLTAYAEDIGRRKDIETGRWILDLKPGDD